MGDHTEVVQLDYDPRIITYEELLKIFWDSHQPTTQSFSRQYMKAVFYHNPEQRETALASKSDLEQKVDSAVKTGVVPIRSFTSAEGYHQKFMLKNNGGLHKEMATTYPQHADYVNSTAVARLNGYAGGYGTKDQALAEIDILGLSPEGKNRLKEIARR